MLLIYKVIKERNAWIFFLLRADCLLDWKTTKMTLFDFFNVDCRISSFFFNKHLTFSTQSHLNLLKDLIKQLK